MPLSVANGKRDWANEKLQLSFWFGLIQINQVRRGEAVNPGRAYLIPTEMETDAKKA